MKDLKVVEEDYSPVLQYKTGGSLRYDDVPAYDRKWLPKDKEGKGRKGR